MIDVAMFASAIAFALSGQVWFALLTSWFVEGLRSPREPIFGLDQPGTEHADPSDGELVRDAAACGR